MLSLTNMTLYRIRLVFPCMSTPVSVRRSDIESVLQIHKHLRRVPTRCSSTEPVLNNNRGPIRCFFEAVAVESLSGVSLPSSRRRNWRIVLWEVFVNGYLFWSLDLLQARCSHMLEENHRNNRRIVSYTDCSRKHLNAQLTRQRVALLSLSPTADTFILNFTHTSSYVQLVATLCCSLM